MPKDATKNVDRYKVRGGELNEFDFHQNQEEFAEERSAQASNLIPGTPPEARVARLRPVPKKATKATKTKKAIKATKATKASPRGASAKKLAARKASKKK